MLDLLFATSPSWAITIVRVALGVIFFAHGAQKVLGWFGGHFLEEPLVVVDHALHGFRHQRLAIAALLGGKAGKFFLQVWF